MCHVRHARRRIADAHLSQKRRARGVDAWVELMRATDPTRRTANALRYRLEKRERGAALQGWRAVTQARKSKEEDYTAAWEARRVRLARESCRVWLVHADATTLQRSDCAEAVELNREKRRFGAVNGIARRWRRKGQALLRRERAGEAARLGRGAPLPAPPVSGLLGGLGSTAAGGLSVAASPLEDYFQAPSTKRRAMPRQLLASHDNLRFQVAFTTKPAIPAPEAAPGVSRLDVPEVPDTSIMQRELAEALTVKKSRDELRLKLSQLQDELEYYQCHQHASPGMLEIGDQRKVNLEAELQEADRQWDILRPKVERFAACIGEARARGTSAVA